MHPSDMLNKFKKIIVIINLFLMILLFNFPVNGEPRQNSQPTEYEVQAAFLYNFIKFVEWPEEVFPDSLSPIIIGIIGQDPFGELIESMIMGRTIQSRKIVIKRYYGIEDYQYCHVLYMGFKERRYHISTLNYVKKTPVLTIGNTEGFTRLGGMINFIITGKQIGFEINLDTVEKSKLKISAQLLRLAKITHN